MVPPVKDQFLALSYSPGYYQSRLDLKLLKAQVHCQKITVLVQGVVTVQLKDLINTRMDRLGQFAKEATRVSQEVGTEGKLGGQALILNVEGTWRELMVVRSIEKLTKAIALGDFIKQFEVDGRGEILDLKNTVNGWLDYERWRRKSQGELGGQAHVPDVEGIMIYLEVKQEKAILLSTLANEVTRVSLEVGTEGILGGHAFVPDVQECGRLVLPDNVNLMAMILTNQSLVWLEKRWRHEIRIRLLDKDTTHSPR
ncbi:hypothetical protein BYT27DRAFT_7216790 [Phlegmacium glaucopus]|nr:hypothetical protein BYT27DRAFT_7216790 [Phlegmacium glaucopus]